MLRLRNTLFFLFIATLCAAQVQLSSPISILGFGQLVDNDQMYVGAVGGTRASFHSPDKLNVANPASLAHLQTTVFSGGLQAARTKLSDGSNTTKVWSGNVAYFSLGFTLQNQINELFDRKQAKVRWGMDLSLRPYSVTGFDFQDIDPQSNGDTLQRSYIGDGSTYVLSWGNGWKYKNVSFGVSAGYLFGGSDIQRRAFFISEQVGQAFNYATIEAERINYRGFVWNTGVQYDWVLDHEIRADGSKGAPNKYLTVGLTYHGDWGIKAEQDFNILRENVFFQNRFQTDTLLSINDVERDATIPQELNFGLSYVYKDKWRIGVNYRQSLWSNYVAGDGSRTSATSDAFLLSGGIAYTPNANSITQYFERVTYTFATHYGKDPRVLNGEQLESYGARVGVMLPFVGQRQVSYLNLNVGYGRLGTANGYRENTWTFGLGYTLTDNQWFIKRKYD